MQEGACKETSSVTRKGMNIQQVKDGERETLLEGMKEIAETKLLYCTCRHVD